MAIVANLTPTPVPANTALGGSPMQLFHVKVTSAGGAGTYEFLHGLPYTPTVHGQSRISQKARPRRHRTRRGDVLCGFQLHVSRSIYRATRPIMWCTVDPNG